ncbi:DUF2155 domain-containing protein [Roseibacterium sp. SDUM158017]|uniref:DUF2155 domain-containing protein n=1 Tax=Roseicyclus salinarum TaxID=3036773 RepID=UPI002415040E|nr:DUF2155 domain-containing protein [Roseibacterium sp. SDUM158017]MDG4648162.1 DUF2155 domain-containing protein [Roseibacterium sp. SDUM158017]
MTPRHVLLAAMLATAPVAAASQTFDNFEQSPLPPLPEGAQPGAGGEDALNPSWLDGDGVLLPETDGGVVLETNPGGQSGVLLENFPGVSGPVTSVSQPPTRQGDRITLRALDRMLGRPTDLEMSVGQTVLFGRVAIHVPECRYPADNPAADAFAHVRILDTAGYTLFDGWMVASSPALSALEHPRYDVWVLRCSSTS